MEGVDEIIVHMSSKLDKIDKIDIIVERLPYIQERLDSVSNVLEQVQNVRQEMIEVNETISDLRSELYQVMGKQAELEYELKLIKEQPHTTENNNELEENLDLYMNDIHETLDYHQRYLEQVDNDSRRRNLIFHGVPENYTSELGINDMEKVKNVIKETGHSTLIKFKTERLGRESEDQEKPRPILVKMDNGEVPKLLLSKARQLKNKAGFSKIYIKKDLHYTVRKELSRLKQRELQEKSGPKNSKNNIKLDLKDRVLRINGLMVDKFHPSF